MPVPANLTPLIVELSGGYFPSAPALAPEALQRTIRAGSGVWVRPAGLIEVADGLLEVSSTNVGARLFVANTQRASIAGGLVGSRLPFAGLLRYQNAVLFFLSENTSAQVYLDETLISGLTTSATAGGLRVAIPDGLGGYNTYDAGFTAPSSSTDFSVSVTTNIFQAEKPMVGPIGVALARWRSSTNAIGPPSDIVYNNISPLGTTTIDITPVTLSPVAGQDGWIYCATRWSDQSGDIRILRYVYIQPRGTFHADSGSPDITGTGTFWTQDLQVGDGIIIDLSIYGIDAIISDTELTLHSNYSGVTGSGKTMAMNSIHGSWYDSELGDLINLDALAPPPSAGVLQYAGRVFIWGCRGDSGSPTGSAVIPMLADNPEHVDGILAIVAQSGSDLVNVLAADGPMYLMTTTDLEIVTFTSDPTNPFIIRIVAEPGFKAGTNGVLYKDFFYGFNSRPIRTQAGSNIDVLFAQPVWSDMATWDGTRVIVAVDPHNEAVLYIYDDGAATTVIPFMAQLGVWGPPLNLSARILDAQVVDGVLYVTYLSGGNIRVNEWEGGSGIGGTRYVASQYYDANALNRNRLKGVLANGKLGSVSIYAATPGAAVPDVSNLAAATATFPLSDTAEASEPEIFTNIEARALAFRLNFTSNDGTFQKLIARGTPRSERR